MTGQAVSIAEARDARYRQACAELAAVLSGRSGGTGRTSQVAENLSIMLPEGAGVAAIMNELNFHLKQAEMSGFTGVLR